MRSYLFGAAMIAANAVIAAAGNARADPPPPMWVGSFHLHMIVCKSDDLLKQLVEAQKISGEKVKEVKTSIGDRCRAAYVRNVVVGDSEDLGIVETGDKYEHLWIVHFGTANGDFFGLYEEKVDEGMPA